MENQLPFDNVEINYKGSIYTIMVNRQVKFTEGFIRYGFRLNDDELIKVFGATTVYFSIKDLCSDDLQNIYDRDYEPVNKRELTKAIFIGLRKIYCPAL